MSFDYLKKAFEMKDLGRTKFCLGLQIEYFNKGTFIYQETYITNMLKMYYIGKSYPLCTLIVVSSLDVDKNPFKPQRQR